VERTEIAKTNTAAVTNIPKDNFFNGDECSFYVGSGKRARNADLLNQSRHVDWRNAGSSAVIFDSASLRVLAGDDVKFIHGEL
jgi:hypothetical protein